ncbi:DUF6933 domain-containing protein [Oscillibacter sp.]|uniref:DUF6933 domain-containing protein n=1 Tax=Oscillibacter sp. TaxID=1945593 RepID=UPI001B3E3796|nr:hypothetical protein [Oscillibacter sp.]MBP3508794.1 hypothetical protein [Oscillibacter sp.]
MQLGLTFPLQRKLKIKFVPYGALLERLYCWDLHCITLWGQDSLLLVHCASRYTIVACGVTGFDWENLSAFAMEQIRAGLLDVGLPEQTVADHLRESGAPELTRTHGRREVAFLNRAWNDVLALDFTVDTATVRQPLLEQAVNGIPCRCAGFEGREAAKQFLYRSFQLR